MLNLIHMRYCLYKQVLGKFQVLYCTNLSQ